MALPSSPKRPKISAGNKMPWQVTYTQPENASTPRTCSYGWVPDRPDKRDVCYRPPRKLLDALPPSVDLRPHCPPIYRQGTLNSCTAQAIAAAIEFEQLKQ